MGMRLYDTPEMAELWKGIKQYIEHGSLREDAPDKIKKDYKEYLRLGKEQYDFAMKLNEGYL